MTGGPGQAAPVAPPVTVGLVLAAGGGSRFGMPKALAPGRDGRTWAADAANTLAAGGCDNVLVVVGAQAAAVVEGLPPEVTAVQCEDWAQGLAATLRTGLIAAQDVPGVVRVVVVPVDTPGLSPAAVRRVLEAAGESPGALVRATYNGVPGHPVVFGAGHLSLAAKSIGGDRGARDYLRDGDAVQVECADIAVGGH